MQWDLVVLIVVATIWSLGVFFGLVLPDKTANRILDWVAEVEHQPFWWLPVGLFSFVLFFYGLNKAVNIQVNWSVLARSMVFLVGVIVYFAITFAIRVIGRRNKSEEKSELEEEEV